MHLIVNNTGHDISTMIQQLYFLFFSLNFYTIAELTIICTEKLTQTLLEYDMIEWKFILQYLENLLAAANSIALDNVYVQVLKLTTALNICSSFMAGGPKGICPLVHRNTIIVNELSQQSYSWMQPLQWQPCVHGCSLCEQMQSLLAAHIITSVYTKSLSISGADADWGISFGVQNPVCEPV